MTGPIFRMLVPLVLAASPALAAPSHPEGDLRFGVDAAVALAVGDFSRGNSFGNPGIGPGFGALVRYENAANPVLSLTLRAGLLQHLESEGNTIFGGTVTRRFREIPLLAGFRVDVARSVFLAGEGGLFNSQMDGRWSHDFGLGLALGLRPGPVELGFGLQCLAATTPLDTAMFLFNLGYSFSRF